jgi:hypothetical protein
MKLQEVEAQGYRLDVEAERLAVYGPEYLLSDNRLELLRKHRDELIDQVLVRKFCQLVKHYGADRGVLLSDEEITRELDEKDVACLRRLEIWDKHVWAELLADRLTRNWTIADRIPKDTTFH